MVGNNRKVIKVQEWIYNQILNGARNNYIYIRGEYTEAGLDYTTLYVEDVLAETEKAFKYEIDAETSGGLYKGYECWIPKSAVLETVDC